jgi:alkylation response protein AidB-like acyl-CoA dehydrogenase
VHLALTAEQTAFQTEIRSYFTRLIEEVTAGGPPETGTHYKEYTRRMGQDGWLGIGWPTEFGGQGRPLEEQLIFVEESHRAGVPLPLLTLNSVGPTIMRMGTDEQKERFLPGILKGEIHFAIGYTEPNAGTDLAALRTRAVRDGDEYVIDGQKIYTSAIQYADYVWLAVRTDPEAPKHKGLSVLIVPTDAAGFSWAPLETMGGEPTSTTFYEGVRVPVENLVGEENGGWRLITNQLNHERLAITPAGGLMRLLDDVRAWAATTTLADGRRVIDQEWVQLNLARVKAKVEALRLFNWRVASAVGGAVGPADASATKVYGSELNIEAHRLLLEVLGESGYLPAGSPGAVLAGRLERAYRSTIIFTFGGGANEVQRDIVAMVGLGMPRAPR